MPHRLQRKDPVAPGNGARRSRPQQLLQQATFITLIVATIAGITPAVSGQEALPPGADWPQFRGPLRDGSAPPDAVDVTTPPVEAWRRELGAGFSSVIVAGDSIYTQFSEPTGESPTSDPQELVGRFDASSGDELWRRELGPLFENSWGNGPRSTPTHHKGRIYALGSYGRLAAFDASSGEELWRHELGELAGVTPPDFGYSPAPLVLGNAVVTEVGASENGLIRAFDLESGEPLWAVESGRAGYSTPVILGSGPDAQAVFLTRDAVLGVSPGGEILWRWPLGGGSPYDLPIASPLPVGDRQIFVAHRAEGGSALLEVTSAGIPEIGDTEAGDTDTRLSNTRAAPVWESLRMLAHLHAPVHHEGVLYGFHNATLQAVDLPTGEILWRQRGFGKGSLLTLGDQLLVAGESGEIAAVEASPEAYRELYRFQPFTGRTWTAPSYSRGVLYLRSGSEMAAYRWSDRPRAESAETASLAPPKTSSTPPAERLAEPVASPTNKTSQAAQASALLQHAEARGGIERIERVRGHRWTGRYTTNGQPAKVELTRQADGSIHLEMRGEIVDGGEVPQTLDWNGQSGKRLQNGETTPLELEEATSFQLESRLLGPLLAPLPGQKIESLGLGGFDTVHGLHFRVTTDSASEAGPWVEDWYLDPETHLPLALSTRRWAWGRMRDISYYFSDWRDVDGLLLPFAIEDEFSSFHRRLEIEEIELLE